MYVTHVKYVKCIAAWFLDYPIKNSFTHYITSHPSGWYLDLTEIQDEARKGCLLALGLNTAF